MASFEIKAGTNGIHLIIDFKDAITEVAKNTEGCTAKVYWSIDHAATQTADMTMLTPPGTNGKWYYDFTANQITRGTMEIEGEVSDGSGHVLPTTNDIRLIIGKRIKAS